MKKNNPTSPKLPPKNEDAPVARLRAAQALLRQPVVKDIIADMSAFLPANAAGEAAGAVAELIRWALEPTKLKEWQRKKDREGAEDVVVPEGEPPQNAPEVNAEIVGVRCLEPGWLQITIRVDATAGADGDDVVSVRLGLPSPDCNGYRHRQLHRFRQENESQSHSFTVRLKCSDLISRSETRVDVFVWVELQVFDDDGNSRTVYMRLASPELDRVAGTCCRKE